jgi:hypothetical protein
MRWRYEIKTDRALPVFYLYRWWGILKDAVKTVVILVGNVVSLAGRRNAKQADVPIKASN